MLNHTATHLVNFALARKLGSHVQQRGSLVLAEKFRFDFSHNKPLTEQQLRECDDVVNKIIQDNLIVSSREVTLSQAMTIKGLRTVPGEVYPDPVRVISVGINIDNLLAEPTNDKWLEYSIEFCGGTHLENTQPIKLFTIVDEEAVGKGVRRIVALTGEEALKAASNAKEFEKKLADKGISIADLLNELGKQEMPACSKMHFRNVIGERQKQEKKSHNTEFSGQSQQVDAFAKNTIDQLKSNPQSFFVGRLDEAGGHNTLLSDTIKAIQTALPDLPVLLFSSDQAKKKVTIVAKVPKSVLDSKKLKANTWASEAVQICGGKGGGKPDTAQGSGNDVSKIEEAITVANKFAT
jgi:alanyl-tRNA synthetase